METTGKALVEHWHWAAHKGLMNLNTARVMRNACLQILAGVFPDDWEETDVSGLEPDAIFSRFQNLRGKDLTPRSLQDYKRRFQQALESYRSYVDDPASWKGPGQERPSRTENNSAQERTRLVDRKSKPSLRDSSESGLVEYPFPIRDLTAKLILPRDLRLAEAKRLGAFITSLAADAEEWK